MYLKLFLIIILVLVLVAISYENYTEYISPDVNRNNFAQIKNVEFSANIPGVNDTSIYENENKCLKFEANSDCSSGTRSPYSDGDCLKEITSSTSGKCKCLKKDVDITCDGRRTDTNCEKICSESYKPKTLEFNGKDSLVSIEQEINATEGYTISFYIKLPNFLRFPVRPQLICLAQSSNKSELYEIYINENRILNIFDTKNAISYSIDKPLDNEWHIVSFGSSNSNQFLQLDGKRKELTNIDAFSESITFFFGNYPDDYDSTKKYAAYNGLLGNIGIVPKYLLPKDIEPMLSVDTELKCIYAPGGNTMGECIRKCRSSNTNCNIDQCIMLCETCQDKDACKFLKADKKCSFNEPDQEVVENPDKCFFKPFGTSEAHCVSQCSEGFNKSYYGGDLCTQTSCSKICKGCTDMKYCQWLDKTKAQKGETQVPNPPHGLIGLPANNMALLQWNQPASNNSEIKGYKVLYYKSRAPEQGVFMYSINEDLLRTPLKYNLRGLDNGVQYIIGVVAINSVGSSKISKLISVTPGNSRMEGFQNYENQDTENDDLQGCNLFNSLMGKEINISL